MKVLKFFSFAIFFLSVVFLFASPNTAGKIDKFTAIDYPMLFLSTFTGTAIIWVLPRPVKIFPSTTAM